MKENFPPRLFLKKKHFSWGILLNHICCEVSHSMAGNLLAFLKEKVETHAHNYLYFWMRIILKTWVLLHNFFCKQSLTSEKSNLKWLEVYFLDFEMVFIWAWISKLQYGYLAQLLDDVWKMCDHSLFLWNFFMSETSEKIHNSTFQVKISV